MAARLSLSSLEVSGRPRVVLSGLLPYSFDFNQSGDLVYRPPSSTETGRLMVKVDRAGKATELVNRPRSFGEPKISPDGLQIAVTVLDSDGLQQVWIYDALNGTGRPLTFQRDGERLPSGRPNWSSSGDRLLFRTSLLGGRSAIAAKPVQGGADIEVLHEGVDLWPSSLSVDNVVAYYEVDRATNDRDIWTYSIVDRVAVPFLVTGANERNPQFSPDGRWIAFVSDKTGQDEVWIRPYPKQREEEYLISVEGGGSPAWAPNGKELYYIDLSGYLVSVPLDFSPAPRPGTPDRLFLVAGVFDFDASRTRNPYDVYPDNTGFVMVTGRDSETSSFEDRQFNVVFNWFEELESLVPSR